LNEQLIALAIQSAPNIIAGLKALFRKEHPDAPEPTDAEVIEAYNQAFESSVSKDDRWLAVHPEQEIDPET
jgi:hypothetical protein